MFAPCLAPNTSLKPTFDPQFARDTAAGLTSPRKTLPASWLYDDIGSALFDVITLLPEYGLTRADAALLDRAADEIVTAAGQPELIVELGSGSGAKTRCILAAAAKRRQVKYCPIDISPAALKSCETALAALPNVEFRPIAASYHEGLERALSSRKTDTRALILFLGSTIGNFSPSEAHGFLSHIRRTVRPGDSLLVGADLIKPTAKLIAAYDDPIGVTAAFNLNLLARMNRELGGEFDLSTFAHEARFNERHSRIEMHLRSRISQTVRIAQLGLAVHFKEGETIWTESSYKFCPEEFRRLGERAGWSFNRQWLDSAWGFAETLFAA